MLRNITIENFRGFTKATLSNISTINVITGFNGTGKTSILEAIFLICGGANASLSASLNGFRGDNIYNIAVDRPFRSIFKNLDPSESPTISSFGEKSTNDDARGQKAPAVNKDKTKRILTIKPLYSTDSGGTTTTQSPTLSGITFFFDGPSGKITNSFGWQKPQGNQILLPLNQNNQQILTSNGSTENKDAIAAQFISPHFRDMSGQDHKALTQLVKERRLDQALNILKMIHPPIKNLFPLSENNVQVIFADTGAQNMLPTSLLGAGFSNLMHIILPLIVHDSSVILIDEFEDGLHYSLLEPILRALFEVLKAKKHQLFITTHSKEFLENLITVAQDLHKNEEVVFYRMGKLDKNNNIPRYDLNEATDVVAAQVDMR
jgi:predicted ATP-dependent endonuclease of OLD family